MTAWRVRLNRIWYLLIISPAFLEAFCVTRVSFHSVFSSGSVLSETYIHSIPAGRDLAGVALAQSPVERVGKSVFTEVAEELLIDLESGEVGYIEK